MSDFQQHVRQLADKLGGAGKLATASGLSPRSIAAYIAGETDPKRADVIKLARSGGVSVGWLAAGEAEGPMQAREPHAPYGADATPRDGYVYLPLYDLRAAAGYGALIEDRPATEHWAFSRPWLERELHVLPSRLILSTIAGDSMVPDLYDGDVVMVDRGDTERLREGVYFFMIDHLVFVKRLRLEENKLSVISTNPAHPVQSIDLYRENSSFKVLGRVIGQPVFKRF